MSGVPRKFWVLLAAAIFVSRAAHVNILWADEDYHLAVAIQALHGKMLYRDVWYDKPPLNALFFTLFGAWPGWPLRFLSMAVELAGAVLAYRFASSLWSRREGMFAAAGFVFFHIFFYAASTIPLEPDSLMILPHIYAAYLAWRGRPLLAGVMAGLSFLLNTKGVFVLAACLAMMPADGWRWQAGFAIPVAAAGVWLFAEGAFRITSRRYGAGACCTRHIRGRSRPTIHFCGSAAGSAFTAALCAGTIIALLRVDRTDRRKFCPVAAEFHSPRPALVGAFHRAT
ncbi:MAG: glycosyltransferase family 39 protein [Acidobacteriota bacterium]